MILKLDLAILNDGGAFGFLDHLMIIIQSGKHVLQFQTDDLDIVFASDWFNGLGERLQDSTYELLKKSAVNSSFISNSELQHRGIYIIKSGFDQPDTIDNAIKIFEENLYIIVEDIENDQLFITRLLEVYKNAGKNIKRALDRGWCKFSHAGGKTRAPAVINNHFKARAQPFKPRLIVIIDSDKRSLEEAYSLETQRVIDLCANKDIDLHIYEKREIENYVPDEVIIKKTPATLSDTVASYCAMTPLQKDFFDLEKGFQNNRPTEENLLYAKYRKSDEYHHLKIGFHRDDFNAKKEIVSFVLDEGFNQFNIQQRCNHQTDSDELKNVLKKIDRLL